MKSIVFGKNIQGRIVFCLLMALVSLLLLGTVGIKSSYSRKMSRVIGEKEKVSEVLSLISTEIPSEHLSEWRNLAKNDPYLLVIASSSRIMPMNPGE